MRLYLSVDLEGMPGIFDISQTDPKGWLHQETRKMVTNIVKNIVQTLFNNDVDEIYIADAHWYMGNIIYEELRGNVHLIRGALRPISMMYGIDKGFDAAMLIGYHSGAGVEKSVLEHTYSSGTFHEIKINGKKASEFYLNTLIAGHYNTPVILVAGDEKLREEVKNIAPWIEYVTLKESISRYAAITPSLDIIYDRLRKGIENSLEKLSNSDTVKPLKITGKIMGEFSLKNSAYADYVERLPGIERIDTYTVRYVAKNIIELYNVISIIFGLSRSF